MRCLPLVLIGWTLAVGVVGDRASAQSTPRVRYRLRYDAAPPPGAWDVEVAVSGLRAAQRDVHLHLSNWGEWLDVAASHVTRLESEPPLVAGAGTSETFRFVIGDGWNGALRVSYRIPLRAHGGAAQRAHGLLPWRRGELASGFANNTLPRVLVGDGRPLAAERSVELSGPDGIHIATGWAGVSRSLQDVTLAGDIDQCLILFSSEAPFVTTSGRADRPHEIVQFGAGEDITGPIATITAILIDSYAESTGQPLGRRERVFITGDDPGGGGGVRTDWGIGIGYNADPSSPRYRQTLAHELYHEWLPGKLAADGDPVVWFFEGFTDYMALWHAARVGVVEREWFAQRILEIDARARASSAFGRTSFADPTIQWRDGDGPLETLAYRGGALLAFHMDAQLRARKHAGLAALLREFMCTGAQRYSLTRLRRALEARGLERFYTRHVVEGAALPDTRTALRELGWFRRTAERDGALTYFGIATDRGPAPGRVTAIDPEGPSAERDVRVGDVILAGFPPRDNEIRVKQGFRTEYSFGLTSFATTWGADGWWVELRRDGKTLRVDVEPWLQAGQGREKVWVADRDAIAPFFESRH